MQSLRLRAAPPPPPPPQRTTCAHAAWNGNKTLTISSLCRSLVYIHSPLSQGKISPGQWNPSGIHSAWTEENESEMNKALSVAVDNVMASLPYLSTILSSFSLSLSQGAYNQVHFCFVGFKMYYSIAIHVTPHGLKAGIQCAVSRSLQQDWHEIIHFEDQFWFNVSPCK